MFLKLHWHHIPLGMGWGQNVGHRDFARFLFCFTGGIRDFIKTFCCIYSLICLFLYISLNQSALSLSLCVVQSKQILMKIHWKQVPKVFYYAYKTRFVPAEIAILSVHITTRWPWLLLNSVFKTSHYIYCNIIAWVFDNFIERNYLLPLCLFQYPPFVTWKANCLLKPATCTCHRHIYRDVVTSSCHEKGKVLLGTCTLYDATMCF